MKTRAMLTTVWLVSLLAAIAISEAYFLRKNADGIPFLLPHDRVPVYQALALLYGANVGAILAAWFTKPFPKLTKSRLARLLSRFALVLTIAYNVLLLYLIAQGHFSQTDPIDVVLHRVKIIGGALAFLVAPVNAYYFGVKPQA